ncbi:alanine--tRNA ligase [Patescibacteria group bacterium]|nr:alanine--tRNA ligase [Patescibacteria group bacterium]MCL5009985.1 alanine--tRNA ligase [Patescibacteria group bacterium]
MTSLEILEKYLAFFTKRGHIKIPNSALVPENDPSTLFTSSGMQPLLPYLLGEKHGLGKRLMNVQNCFRAVDIDSVGDNKHITFFRMLGNWSLGDYFKKEQIAWIWEFITKELKIPKDRLYISLFKGFGDIKKDEDSKEIWSKILIGEGLDPKERIFFYSEENWWSRTNDPNTMPEGEPGGPDSEVFYRFDAKHNPKFGKTCHPNCPCGRFLEIGNSVFMEFKKGKNGFEHLPQKNVDFGGGLERLLAAVENEPDIFQTSLFAPIIQVIEETTEKSYLKHKEKMRIITDHLIASGFIIINNIKPSNKEQGYILRRLIRRSLDNFYLLNGKNIAPILKSIAKEYGKSDQPLIERFEEIKDTILEEEQKYNIALTGAKKFIIKKYKKTGDELMGAVRILAEDAFLLYSTHGLSPSQIKSLGYTFDEKAFAEKMKGHQKLSKKNVHERFRGGLKDHQEKTIMGHTATHLLHQALREVLGNHVYQTGSNITTDRVRFDFNYENKLSDSQLTQAETIVNKKISENLPVHFEMLPIDKARKKGAIGLFDAKYKDKVKVYFIGTYSIEFCGGPHVDFTGRLKSFKIIKQESIGNKQRRIYAKVNN